MSASAQNVELTAVGGHASDLMPLIYDVAKSGHRLRDSYVLSRVLSGQVRLQSVRQAWRDLIRFRGPLIWLTADYELIWFTSICLIRSALGRRTVGICYRNNSVEDGKYLVHKVRLFLFWLWNCLPNAVALTCCPSKRPLEQKRFLYDIEWWDLVACPLDLKPVAPSLEDSVVFLGNPNALKGGPFFIEAALTAKRRGSRWKFVLVGLTRDISPQMLAMLQEADIQVIAPPADDGEFVAYMASAGYLWCCYNPVYDQSSGIFGRSLQLSRPSIVRSGSLLVDIQKRYGAGIAVTYGDAEAAVDALEGAYVLRDSTALVQNFLNKAVTKLKSACGTSGN